MIAGKHPQGVGPTLRQSPPRALATQSGFLNPTGIEFSVMDRVPMPPTAREFQRDLVG